MRYGVDYYPEQWERERRARDVERMAAMGFESARMMEFAWAVVEPEPGRFDFSLFDEVLGFLEGRGMKAVLGTPTAAPPAWIMGLDPDFRAVYVDGTVRDFGQRREACLSGPAYREASRRVVAEIARRYGRDGRVEGFQVDNEIGHEGSDRCVCPRCAAGFARWLEARYGSVGAVNDAWGTSFWSERLRAFSDATPPRASVSVGQNPSLVLDYYRYMSELQVGFAAEQAAILRAASDPGKWITTNLYSTPLSAALDARRLMEPMDVAGWDNYPVWGDQDEPIPHYFNSYMLSYARGLKGGKPFAVMEQFSGFQGHACLGHRPPDAVAALWAAQAAAQGADRIYYFRWRTARRGQEQLCHGIFDADDRENGRSRAIRAHIREGRAAFKDISPVPVESEACVAYHRPSLWLLRDQYLSKGLDYKPVAYMQAGGDRELARNYAPFSLLHVNCDVVDVDALDPGEYKLIVLPLYQLADEAVAARLSAWVEAGGVLVLGFRAGARTADNAATESPLPGPFAAMAGLEVEAFESLNATKGKMRFRLLSCEAENWAEVLDCKAAKPLARHAGRKWYAGRPAVAVNHWGKGLVYYVGTSPGPLGLLALFGRIMRSAGLKPRFRGMSLESVLRKAADGSVWRVVLNHSSRKKRAFGATVAPYGCTVVPAGRRDRRNAPSS